MVWFMRLLKLIARVKTDEVNLYSYQFQEEKTPSFVGSPR